LKTDFSLEKIAGHGSANTPSIGTWLSRASQILRHYSWRQLFCRGLAIGKRKVSRRYIPLSDRAISSDLGPTPPLWQEISGLVAKDHFERPFAKSVDFETGTFRLLNHEVRLGRSIDWARAQNESHLWRFQLQYQEFLLSILATEQEKSELAWEFLEQWLHAFANGKLDRWSDAWHPYCISRRLPVWLWLLTCADPPQELSQRLLAVLLEQKNYLANNLERDLGGNHLLENLHALNLVCVCLPQIVTPDEARIAASRLEAQLETQLLSSGEHFERSPMYHCHVLANTLLTIGAEEAFTPALGGSLRQPAARMLNFLESICHPDGEIPLFGDSGFGEAMSTSAIRTLADKLGLARLTTNAESTAEDYWVSKTGQDLLIVDCGSIAAPNLPAHGHCDLLSFEGAIEGRRWLVDSGNFDYEESSMRSYCRSSIAHNVVTLDRRNMANVWAKFRMGDRPRVLKAERGARDQYHWLHANYGCFRGIQNTHASRYFAAGEGFWLCLDSLEEGRKRVCEGWLHLAPELEIDVSQPNQFTLRNSEVVRYLSFFGCIGIDLVDGWYCPAFGQRLKSTVLCYSKQNDSPHFGWLLTRERCVEFTTNLSFLRFLSAEGVEQTIPVPIS
jgi:hypothetical protein